MELVVAHKGKKGWRCRVRGLEAHSSLTPLGVNAVQIACEIVAYIARRAREFRDAGRRDDAYDVPVHHGARRHHPRRHRAQHRAARLHVRLRDPPPAVRRSRRVLRRRAGVRRALPARRCTPSIRRRYIEFDHLSTLPGFDTHDGSADHRARPRVQRHARRRQGVVRHRGLAVPRRRACRRSSAAPATSRRRTSRTNGSRSSRSRAARRSCSGWSSTSRFRDARRRRTAVHARRQRARRSTSSFPDLDALGRQATPASPMSGVSRPTGPVRA